MNVEWFVGTPVRNPRFCRKITWKCVKKGRPRTVGMCIICKQNPKNYFLGRLLKRLILEPISLHFGRGFGGVLDDFWTTWGQKGGNEGFLRHCKNAGFLSETKASNHNWAGLWLSLSNTLKKSGAALNPQRWKLKMTPQLRHHSRLRAKARWRIYIYIYIYIPKTVLAREGFLLVF